MADSSWNREESTGDSAAESHKLFKLVNVLGMNLLERIDRVLLEPGERCDAMVVVVSVHHLRGFSSLDHLQNMDLFLL
ncbi:hypothetical protein DPMN_013747, partial [Dreissena polymorpha]